MGDCCSRSPGIGDDGKPVAAESRLSGVDPPVGVKVLDGVAADDPGLLKDAVVEEIGTGECPGVTEARPGACSRSADVLGEDRL